MGDLSFIGGSIIEAQSSLSKKGKNDSLERGKVRDLRFKAV
jgi:hypothetical protein